MGGKRLTINLFPTNINKHRKLLLTNNIILLKVSKNWSGEFTNHDYKNDSYGFQS